MKTLACRSLSSLSILVLPVALAAWGCSSSSDPSGGDGQGGEGGDNGGEGGGAAGRSAGTGGSSSSGGASGGSSGGTSGGSTAGSAAGASGGAVAGAAGGASAGAAGSPAAGASGGAGAAGGAMAGMAGGAGGTPAGGAMGASDKSKEKLMFDGMVTLNGTTNASNVKLPDNWMAPIDYWTGQTQVRLETQAFDKQFSVEMCIYKTNLSDPKHTCPRIVLSAKGMATYERGLATSTTWLNTLAQSTMVADDFKTPFAITQWRLTPAGNHFENLAGPVTGRMTIVLVPAGLAFSGWAGYTGK